MAVTCSRDMLSLLPEVSAYADTMPSLDDHEMVSALQVLSDTSAILDLALPGLPSTLYLISFTEEHVAFLPGANSQSDTLEITALSKTYSADSRYLASSCTSRIPAQDLSPAARFLY